MPRFAAKALVTLLTANKARGKSAEWDRTIIGLSTIVTLGLVALFIYGKATSRW